MGKRVEPRLDVQVPVRIFGTDSMAPSFPKKLSPSISAGSASNWPKFEVKLAPMK